MKRKLRSQGGFSLAEALLATLILLLVAIIMTTGIPAAKDAYEKVVLGSNAQVLLSTTVNALRDELGTAWDVTVSEDEDGNFVNVTYFSAHTGTKSLIRLDKIAETDTFKTVFRQEFAQEADATDVIFGTKVTDETAKYGNAGITLISGQASTSDLYVTYDSVSHDETECCVTFSGLRVCRKINSADVTEPIDLVIRIISEVEASGT